MRRRCHPSNCATSRQGCKRAIDRKLPVRATTLALARSREALGAFDERYQNDVSVYAIGDVSLEICAGPHVENTGELGRFSIVKEQSSGAGVRRIRAVLD